MNSQLADIIDSKFTKVTKKDNIHQASLLVDFKGESYSKTFGPITLDSPIVIASISKLFTTATVLKLVDEQEIHLTDKISDYLKADLLEKLHIYKKKDYSQEITINHLITQTSGLADIFAESKNNFTTQALKQDTHFSVADQLKQNSTLQPHFIPGSDKAYYSDINFILLGLIVETVTGYTLEQAFARFIYQPLQLSHTFLTTEETYDQVPEIYYGSQKHLVPMILESNGAAGGVVSTTRELMIFLKAFFSGELFSKRLLSNSSHRMQLEMTPIHYARGMMLIPLGGVTTMFSGEGELVGHSGISGSFAFYWPEKELYMVGDLNQLDNPSLPVRFVMQLAMKLNKLI